MKIEELIEKYERLNHDCFRRVDTSGVLRDLKQLDELKTGYADEAPRYVKNILARLRELPLHDREVWLKVIISEFKQDFSHAKWREGYEQGKLEGMLERDKVTIPQFIADWIEEKRDQGRKLAQMLLQASLNEQYGRWVVDNQDTFARAWLDGYEVEKEKRYKVVMPNVSSTGGVLTRIKHDDSWIWIDTLGTIIEGRTHTRKELEEAGFGWVFDCEGVEVEEVEE